MDGGSTAPAAGTGGSYPLTISAANGVLPNASQRFTLTVLPPIFTLSGTVSNTSAAPISGAPVSAGNATTGAFSLDERERGNDHVNWPRRDHKARKWGQFR